MLRSFSKLFLSMNENVVNEWQVEVHSRLGMSKQLIFTLDHTTVGRIKPLSL